MANIEELTTKVAQLHADLDAEQEQIAAALGKLNQSIQNLEAMVADGGTAEQRQALSDELTAISEDLKSTIPDEPEPTPEV